MSNHLCVACMRRSIYLIRSYPLRSFKRKRIVLNYSYLNSCIIPGFDLKKKKEYAKKDYTESWRWV